MVSEMALWMKVPAPKSQLQFHPGTHMMQKQKLTYMTCGTHTKFFIQLKLDYLGLNSRFTVTALQLSNLKGTKLPVTQSNLSSLE